MLFIGNRAGAGASAMLPHTAVTIVVAAAVALAASAAAAAAAVGGTFLRSDHDARGLAMAGACVCLARGDAAVNWNPARLPYQEVRSVTVAHGDVIEHFSSGLTTISLAIPWGGEPTDEYGLGESARWAVACLVSHFGLEDVGDSADWSESSLSGAVSRTMWGYAAVGVVLKYLRVRSDVDEGCADGAAADLGFSLDTTDRTRAALVVRNAFSSLRWDGGRDETLPARVDLAFSYTHGTLAAAETTVNLDAGGVTAASIGAELSLAQGGLLIWGGFKIMNDSSARYVPSFGVGLPLGGISVGYGASFDEEDTFGTAQRFSVTANF